MVCPRSQRVSSRDCPGLKVLGSLFTPLLLGCPHRHAVILWVLGASPQASARLASVLGLSSLGVNMYTCLHLPPPAACSPPSQGLCSVGLGWEHRFACQDISLSDAGAHRALPYLSCGFMTGVLSVKFFLGIAFCNLLSQFVISSIYA